MVMAGAVVADAKIWRHLKDRGKNDGGSSCSWPSCCDRLYTPPTICSCHQRHPHSSAPASTSSSTVLQLDLSRCVEGVLWKEGRKGERVTAAGAAAGWSMTCKLSCELAPFSLISWYGVCAARQAAGWRKREWDQLEQLQQLPESQQVVSLTRW